MGGGEKESYGDLREVGAFVLASLVGSSEGRSLLPLCLIGMHVEDRRNLDSWLVAGSVHDPSHPGRLRPGPEFPLVCAVAMKREHGTKPIDNQVIFMSLRSFHHWPEQERRCVPYSPSPS